MEQAEGGEEGEKGVRVGAGKRERELVAGKNFIPDNDSDYSASRTRMVIVLFAYESSVYGLSYAVSFVSIITILSEIWLADYGGRWEKLYPGSIRILAVWKIFEER